MCGHLDVGTVPAPGDFRSVRRIVGSGAGWGSRFGMAVGGIAVVYRCGRHALSVALSRFKIQGVGGCGDIFSIRFVAGVGDGLCGNRDGGLEDADGGGAGGMHYGGYFACQ